MGWSRNRELRALRRREAGAVERWFLSHADRVYTFVFYRVGKDPDLAADVVQETFLSALERIEQYDPQRGAMIVWLLYQARNCIRAALRQRGRLRTGAAAWDRIDAGLVSSYLGMSEAALPLAEVERRETAELVQITLTHLPETYRAALVERYFQQRSIHGMALSRATTRGAVKSLLFRARKAFLGVFEIVGKELAAHKRAQGAAG